MPITFFIQSNNRPAPIYIRYREGRSIDAKARTHLLINPDEWSAAKGKAKSGVSLNYELDKLKKRLIDRLNNRQPTEQINTEWLKAFLSPEKQPTTSLIEYYDRYIAAREKEVAQGKPPKSLVSRYRSNQAMLKEIDGAIQIENVNPAFISRFQEHAHKKGYAPTTISRAAKYILTVCRDARRNGLPTHKELDYIKVKTVKVKHIYLTFEELEKIQLFGKSEQLPEYLDNARDWLIISCFTGQRVSDFMRFTKDFIKEENGKQLIEFTQVKTKKVMTIPVHPKIGQILSKRNGDFPRQISDQKYNDYIKEVCRLAGITTKVQGSRKSKETNRKESGTFEKWELVSSHIGRRSFASNFFGQIPTSLLMFVTGHTTEHQFYDYIGKAERTKAFQLAEYF